VFLGAESKINGPLPVPVITDLLITDYFFSHAGFARPGTCPTHDLLAPLE